MITPNNGVKPLTTPTTASFTVSNTLNTPLNVFLSLLAVSSLILKFSLKSLNLADNSTSFSPDNEGNTSFQASPIDLKPLPKLWNILVKPLIMSSLPPRSFQSDNILLRLSEDLVISSPSVSEIPVHNFVDSSLSPNICSKDIAHPEPTCSLSVPINLVKDVTSDAALVNDVSLPIFFIALVNTSAVNQPDSNESLKGIDLSTNTPILSAVLYISSCIMEPPIPACSNERQS